jgi:NAD(P)-dependent dehydrogenase (short-subunit alcohol dehydrogenase family)
MKNKNKQTALITGASSGIGLGLTKGFLAAGFNVVANSRRITAAGTLTPSDDLLLVDGDVGEAFTARNLIHRAEQRFGRVDVLINNAGIFVPKPFVEYTPDDFQRVVSTNLAGFFYIAGGRTPHAAERRRSNHHDLYHTGSATGGWSKRGAYQSDEGWAERSYARAGD